MLRQVKGSCPLLYGNLVTQGLANKTIATVHLTYTLCVVIFVLVYALEPLVVDKINFREWKLLYLDPDFIEISSQRSNCNNPSLLQLTAWRGAGDKRFSKPMMA